MAYDFIVENHIQETNKSRLIELINEKLVQIIIYNEKKDNKY